MGWITSYTIGEIPGASAEMSTYSRDLLVTALLIFRRCLKIPESFVRGRFLMGLIFISLVNVYHLTLR